MHSFRVLVTGGSGFIGSHVVDALAAAGHQPLIFDMRPSPWHEDDVESVIGDIRRVEDLRAAVRGCDAICHLAAAADVGEVHADPAGSTELNGQGTLNVLEAARLEGVTRVVYASTVWVYSDVEATTVDEDTPLRPPAHLYTAGKLSGELYCHSYAELYGLQPTIVRFGIPYGPRARPAAVIPSFVSKALAGEPLTIAGTGEQERSFVYVEDLAAGMARALAPEVAGRTFNLAGTETTTIRGLAEIVRDEVAATDIVHTPGRSGDLKGARIDSSRAERELGWRATTTLRDGVRRYAAWHREHDALALRAPGEAHDVSRALKTLRSASGSPAVAGVLSLVAVLSAIVAVVLGAREEAQAAELAILGCALIAPVWSLTVVDWPTAHRRTQRLLIFGLAALGVLLLGLVSAAPGDTGVHAPQLTLALGISAAASTALWLAPRRLLVARA